MVFYTTIEVQIIFETLLALITGQLAIVGQLGREVHLWKIWLFPGSRGWRWFGGEYLGGWDHWRWVHLILGDYGMTRGGSFLLFPGVRLKSLFFRLPSIIAFAVTFLVVVINSHCQSVHILEWGRFSLFPGRDRILNLIGEPMVVVVVQNTIPPI